MASYQRYAIACKFEMPLQYEVYHTLIINRMKFFFLGKTLPLRTCFGYTQPEFKSIFFAMQRFHSRSSFTRGQRFNSLVSYEVCRQLILPSKFFYGFVFFSHWNRIFRLLLSTNRIYCRRQKIPAGLKEIFLCTCPFILYPLFFQLSPTKLFQSNANVSPEICELLHINGQKKL